MAKKSKQTQAWQSWKSRVSGGAKRKGRIDGQKSICPFFVRKKNPVYFSRNPFILGKAHILAAVLQAVQFLHGLEKSMSNGGEEGCKM